MTTAEAAGLLGVATRAAREAIERQYALLVSATEAQLAEASSVEARAELDIRLAELAAAREVLLAPAAEHAADGGPGHAPRDHGLGLLLGLVAAVVLLLGGGLALKRGAARQAPPSEPPTVLSGPAVPTPPAEVAPPPASSAASAPVAPATAPAASLEPPASSPEAAPSPPEVPALPAREAAPATRYHVVTDSVRGAVVAIYRQPLLVLPADQTAAAQRVAERLEALQRSAQRMTARQIDNLLQLGLQAPEATPVIFSLDAAQAVPLLVVTPAVAQTAGWRSPWALACWWRSLATDALRLIAGQPTANGLATTVGRGWSVGEGQPVSYQTIRNAVDALPVEAQGRLLNAPWAASPGFTAPAQPVRADLVKAGEVEVQTNYGSQLALRWRLDQAGAVRLLNCGDRLKPRLLFGDWLQATDPRSGQVGFVPHRDEGGHLVYLTATAPAAAAARLKRLLGNQRWRRFDDDDELIVSARGGVALRPQPCECAVASGNLARGTRQQVRREIGDWLEVLDAKKQPVYLRWRRGDSEFVTKWLSPADLLRGEWVRRPLGAGRMSAEFPRSWSPQPRVVSGWYRLEYLAEEDGVQLLIEARPVGFQTASAGDLWDEMESDLAGRYGRRFRVQAATRGAEAALARYDLETGGVTWRATTGLNVANGYAYRWLFATRDESTAAWRRVAERFQEGVAWTE
ncbi:MAG: hypothetical protein IT204_15655 [Fimbriimonadaceae bacterium]|nr:hypothetical protein [Fimbriimonadaceae bacterium]